MTELPVLLCVVLWTAGTLWYIRLVLKGELRPALPPWIIMTTTMVLGLVSFWLAPKPTFASGIGFIAGAGSTISVFSVIIYKVVREKQAVVFNTFQKFCLASAAVIVVAWIVLKFVVGGQTASFVANVLTQVLMTVGYVALAERLWNANSRVESLFFWTMIFLGGTASLVVPLREGNVLGTIYGIRAAITAGITVGLLLRIEAKVRALTSSSTSL
jgi:hypothetical protein